MRRRKEGTCRSCTFAILLVTIFLTFARHDAVGAGFSHFLQQEEFQSRPPDLPLNLKSLVGEYSGGNDTLCVLERDRNLYLVANVGHFSRLTRSAGDTFVIGPGWFSEGKVGIFRRNGNGLGASLEAGGKTYQRILFGEENGKSFRIKPLKPVAVLRNDALKAIPPKEEGDFLPTDLVELTRLDSTIHLDIRYASTDNFVGERFYSQARAFLQRPAAQALVRVHRALKAMGYGLLIHDAYRPWYVTKMFWDATPEGQKEFVADPSKGSRHNRGCAVDLSLYEVKTGRPVEMVSGYDEFSLRAYPTYPGGTELQRWHRKLLRQAMESEGFKIFEWEWWHFDYREWRHYPIGTATFEMIQQ